MFCLRTFCFDCVDDVGKSIVSIIGVATLVLLSPASGYDGRLGLRRGSAQLKLKGKPNTPENLRQEIRQFMPEIRFFTMTSDEFVQSVVTTDVLSPEESVFVLKHIAKPDSDTSAAAALNLNPSREDRSSLINKVRRSYFRNFMLFTSLFLHLFSRTKITNCGERLQVIILLYEICMIKNNKKTNRYPYNILFNINITT